MKTIEVVFVKENLKRIDLKEDGKIIDHEFFTGHSMVCDDFNDEDGTERHILVGADTTLSEEQIHGLFGSLTCSFE